MMGIFRFLSTFRGKIDPDPDTFIHALVCTYYRGYTVLEGNTGDWSL